MKRKKDDVKEPNVGLGRVPDSALTSLELTHTESADPAEVHEHGAPEPASSPLGGEISSGLSTGIEITESSVIVTIAQAVAAPTVKTSADRTVIQIERPRRQIEPPAAHSRIPAPHVRISKTAFEKVRETIGSLPAERGGIFVGPDPFCVEDFIFDRGSDSGRSVYYPDTAYLNEILERDHEPHGRMFIGVVHSHPNGYWHPSGDDNWGDVKAARNNLLSKSNAHLPALFIPIVESAATTGQFVLHPFVMLRKDLRVRPARFEVID